MPTPSQQQPAPESSPADIASHISCPPSSDFDIAMPDSSVIIIPAPIALQNIDPLIPKPSTDNQEPTRDTPTPLSTTEDAVSTEPERATGSTAVSPEPKHATADLYDPFPMTRFRPNTTSSFLKPGVRFSGIQRSEKQEYEVTVDIQHVDMASSFLCGYLRIRGLSDAHPTLTTFFEGEMIGTKYTFVTQHPEWGANEKVDWQHWSRFPAWRPLQKDARRPNFMMKNWMHKENIWMRWKEYFVVPDHTITDLPGASFDGFYYICFNQISGCVTGAYYHHKSEQFQHLELKPEPQHLGFDIGFEFK